MVTCRESAPCLLSGDTGVDIWDLSAPVPVSRAISVHPGTQGKQGSGESAVPFQCHQRARRGLKRYFGTELGALEAPD